MKFSSTFLANSLLNNCLELINIFIVWLSLCRLFIFFIYIYIYIYKLATLVNGDQKAPFSIATTLRCRRGHYSSPWIAPLYPLICTLYCWVLSKEVSGTILKIFGMTQSEIESGLLDHWWTLYPLDNEPDIDFSFYIENRFNFKISLSKT